MTHNILNLIEQEINPSMFQKIKGIGNDFNPNKANKLQISSEKTEEILLPKGNANLNEYLLNSDKSKAWVFSGGNVFLVDLKTYSVQSFPLIHIQTLIQINDTQYLGINQSEIYTFTSNSTCTFLLMFHGFPIDAFEEKENEIIFKISSNNKVVTLNCIKPNGLFRGQIDLLKSFQI